MRQTEPLSWAALPEQDREMLRIAHAMVGSKLELYDGQLLELETCIADLTEEGWNQPPTRIPVTSGPVGVWEFAYRNHAGDVAIRKAIPLELWFGTSEFHDGEQWFVHAEALDRDGAKRDFALADLVSMFGYADAAGANSVPPGVPDCIGCAAPHRSPQDFGCQCTMTATQGDTEYHDPRR